MSASSQQCVHGRVTGAVLDMAVGVICLDCDETLAYCWGAFEHATEGAAECVRVRAGGVVGEWRCGGDGAIRAWLRAVERADEGTAARVLGAVVFGQRLVGRAGL